jgi:hypothetical protein
MRRLLVAILLQLVGAAGFVLLLYGVGSIYRPAALVLAGLLLVLWSYGMARQYDATPSSTLGVPRKRGDER